MNEAYLQYLSQLRPAQPNWITELQQEAKTAKVPIMETDGMDMLLQLLNLHQPKHILEIGTATGYSALRMAHALPNTHITTIEKDHERHQKALENIHAFNMNKHITAIQGDALNVLSSLQHKSVFDFVFIDAAKGHYQDYFTQSARLLTEKGVIVLDNVLFRGFVYEHADVPKRFRHLVKHLRYFNQWVMAHPDFHTVILPSGDGIAISSKKT